MSAEKIKFAVTRQNKFASGGFETTEEALPVFNDIESAIEAATEAMMDEFGVSNEEIADGYGAGFEAVIVDAETGEIKAHVDWECFTDGMFADQSEVSDEVLFAHVRLCLSSNRDGEGAIFKVSF